MPILRGARCRIAKLRLKRARDAWKRVHAEFVATDFYTAEWERLRRRVSILGRKRQSAADAFSKLRCWDLVRVGGIGSAGQKSPARRRRHQRRG